MTWQEAGEAWSAGAPDWATLIEPWNVPYWASAFERVAPGPDDRLLDIACGSGLALVLAQIRGARVAVIDAAEGLVDLARRRPPDADVQVGDMNALPWPDATFDVVVSFNGIWAGGDRAMREASRVLAPGGRVVIGFWGSPPRMDLVASWGAALAELMPPDAFQPPGPSRLAIRHSGRRRWEERLRSAFEPFASPEDGVVRLRNEAVVVTASRA